MIDIANSDEPRVLEDAELNAVTGGALHLAFAGIGDIKGESTDNQHKDWIELM